jgi:hypothetical protein
MTNPHAQDIISAPRGASIPAPRPAPALESIHPGRQGRAGHQGRTSDPATRGGLRWVGLPGSAAPDKLTDQLRQRYPHILIWYGEATGHYWAMPLWPEADAELIEGRDPAELAARLAEREAVPATLEGRAEAETPGGRAAAGRDRVTAETG